MRVRLILFLMLVFALVPASASAITGGTPDTSHPYVGMVAGGTTLCSGTLLSPTVFLTAAHCFPDGSSVRVYFGQAPSPGNFVPGTFHADPLFASGNGLPSFASHDEAVVVLDSPVAMSQYGQLPTQGLVDTLKKADIDLVGYGIQAFLTGGGPPTGVGFGLRTFAQTTLVPGSGAIGDTFIKLHANKGGFCFGDSGGPDLVGNTVLAVNSFLTSNTCTGDTYSYRIDTAASLAFINGFLN